MEDIERLKARKLTPEEVRQGLEALERAIQHGDEIFAGRGGEPLPPSWKIINEMRDERTRQLAEAMGWSADWKDNGNENPSQEP